jgi:putative endonuclease
MLMDPEPLSRMPWWRRWFGTRSERSAARYLRKHGYRILFRNHNTPHGEIDLIVADRDVIVFVEVRSTAHEDLARPALSVDRAKQRRLTHLALWFLQQHRLLGRSARFDIIAVSWPPGRATPVIEHHQNAFEPVGSWQIFH